MKVYFTMLIGLSGSGKSTLAEELKNNNPNTVVLSSDKLREELLGNENDQNHNREIFEELHKRAIKALKMGKNVVYDATNLSARRRRNFLKSIKDICCEKVCVVLATPFYECAKRDGQRTRSVSQEVIFSQMKNFQFPCKEEGWDSIEIHASDNAMRVDLDHFLRLNTPHHCTEYHLESIEEHCKMSEELAKSKNEDEIICDALRYHDIGKLCTKTFYNKKGEYTKRAHYYGHESVSAYLFLTSCQFMSRSLESAILITQLIQYHMRPHLEGYTKWASRYNEFFIKRLELVHKYDKLGRITSCD